MFDSVILEVTIGLLFIYCIYSLFASIINEIIASALSLRARKLFHAICRMLTDEGNSPLGKSLLQDFVNHPLIKYMNSGVFSKRPSYINPENFSKSVIDILKGFDALEKSESVNKIREKLRELGKKDNQYEKQSDTVKLLISFLNDAENDLDKFKKSLENWFNDMMERTSGWYKRQSQLIVLSIGFILALSFHVNTFEIVTRLANDKNAREQLINISENYVKNRQTVLDSSATASRLDTLVMRADSIYVTDIKQANKILGLGLSTWKNPPGGLLLSILGCFVTALAISLGAPFWFDLLSLFMKLRGTGKKPEEDKPKTKS